jgi:hypothetical protein
MTRSKSIAVSGAVIGLALFVAVALNAALLYGAYGGLLLATGIFGAPLPQHLLARGLVGFGSILGVFATAAVFAVAGAGTASAVAHLVGAAGKLGAGAAVDAAAAQKNRP